MRFLSLSFGFVVLAIGCSAVNGGSPTQAAKRSHTLPNERVVRIHVWRSVTICKSGALWGTNTWKHKDSVSGTAFGAEIGGRRYFVTAAHVVAPNPDLVAVPGKDGLPKVESERTGIHIGNLALSPSSVRLDFTHDIALLELSAEDWGKLGDVAVYSLCCELPRVEFDELTTWGYHEGAQKDAGEDPDASAAQQCRTVRVNAVDQQAITINAAVPAGFSGGPLLDAEHRVVGVVSRAEGAASVAIPAAFLKLVASQPSLVADQEEWVVR